MSSQVHYQTRMSPRHYLLMSGLSAFLSIQTFCVYCWTCVQLQLYYVTVRGRDIHILVDIFSGKPIIVTRCIVYIHVVSTVIIVCFWLTAIRTVKTTTTRSHCARGSACSVAKWLQLTGLSAENLLNFWEFLCTEKPDVLNMWYRWW